MKQLVVFSVLVILGTAQWVGDVLQIAPMKRLAFALHASPAPKVFTSQNGFETFANRFFVIWQDARGDTHRTELTLKRYDRLRGAYNRRNVFGAAFSYGPVLASNPTTRDMYLMILQRAACGAALQEIGIPVVARRYPIVVQVQPIKPHAQVSSLPMSQTLRCAP